MDKDLLQYLINLSVVIPFFIILMILSVKLSKGSLNKVQNGRYAQVIERTNLTKDTNMFVIKTGNEGCVVLVSQSHTQKIRDLSSEEMIELSNRKENNRTNIFDSKRTQDVAIQDIKFNNCLKKILDKEIKIWRH